MNDDLRRRTVLGASIGAIMAAPLAARVTRAMASGHGDFTIHLVGAAASCHVEVKNLDGHVRRFATTPKTWSRDVTLSTLSRRFAVRSGSGRWRWIVRGDTSEVWILHDDNCEDPATYGRALSVPSSAARGNRMNVDWLAKAFGWIVTRGQTPFDGEAASPADLLSVRRGRDLDVFDTRRNLFTRNFDDEFFYDNPEIMIETVDGQMSDGQYWLSLGAVRRLWDIRVVCVGGQLLALQRIHVGYDSLVTSGDAESLGFDKGKLSEIGTWINDQVKRGFSGTSVLVARHGQVAWRHYAGQALKYSTKVVDGSVRPAHLLPATQQIPVTASTQFDIASNTKMYAANLALQMLVSQGRIDMSRRVCTLPGWRAFRDESTVYTGSWTVGGSGGIKDRYTGKDTIRLIDLMHHRGGLIPDPQYPNAEVAGDLYLQNLDDVANRAEAIDRICRTPLMHAPRTERAYSDVDYMILGLVVEQIVGQPLHQYLQDGVYRSLGLKHTGFRPLDQGESRTLIAATELNGNTRDGNVDFGVLPDGQPAFIRTETVWGQVQDEKAFYTMSGVSGHAGLFSTADDLGVLLQLMSNEGIYDGREYFSPDVLRHFLVPDDDDATYGLGWRTNKYYYFHGGPSAAAFGHTGWTGTITMVDPVRDIQIVLLTNMRHSPVVEPPNGFAAGAFPLADYVGLISRVYSALSEDDRIAQVTVPERSAAHTSTPSPTNRPGSGTSDGHPCGLPHTGA